nr:MAG TPA: hypothetical protein [Caudoviricetes sp.]
MFISTLPPFLFFGDISYSILPHYVTKNNYSL